MKNTDKILKAGSYALGSAQIVRILIHFFPSIEPIQLELIAVTNILIYGAKTLLSKKINN